MRTIRLKDGTRYGIIEHRRRFNGKPIIRQQWVRVPSKAPSKRDLHRAEVKARRGL